MNLWKSQNAELDESDQNLGQSMNGLKYPSPQLVALLTNMHFFLARQTVFRSIRCVTIIEELAKTTSHIPTFR